MFCLAASMSSLSLFLVGGDEVVAFMLLLTASVVGMGGSWVGDNVTGAVESLLDGVAG